MSAVVQTPQSELVALASSPLATGAAARAVAFDCGGEIALSTFLAHVRGLAATLPDRPCALNLCEDRYRFLVAFCAVALRGQTTLLPPSRAPAAIEGVQRQHPDSYCISDGALPPPSPHHVRMPDILPRLDGLPPHIDGEALVAI